MMRISLKQIYALALSIFLTVVYAFSPIAQAGEGVRPPAPSGCFKTVSSGTWLDTPPIFANANVNANVPSLQAGTQVSTSMAYVLGDNFETGRHLLQMVEEFGGKFLGDLRRIGSRGVLFDAGAGQGYLADSLLHPRAAYHLDMRASTYLAGVEEIEKRETIRIAWELSSEYLNQTPVEDRPSYSGVSFTVKRLLPPFDPSRFRMNTGLFEEISDDEISENGVDLIVDFFGIMSYTERPDLVLQRYLGLLNENGVMYLHLGLDRTAIKKPNGRTEKLSEYLRNIPGLLVEELASEGNYRITRTGGELVFPSLKFLGNSDTKNPPPQRNFRWASEVLRVP